jgi:uncharacterized protein YehS (DUF1456 family)
MDKQKLDQLEVELKEIIRIEQVMKYSLLTPGDVISLQELANKGLPRAEFLYGLMLLERRKHAEAYQYLEKCRRHCNEIYLRKIAICLSILNEYSYL